MNRITKEGQPVRILKQYRGQSNNYTSDDSKKYADLYKVEHSDGKTCILCATELDN